MDKPCEICGNIGFVDALTICSKCKVTREHLYCMGEMPEDDPKKWVCKDCHSNRFPSSIFAQNKQPCSSGMRFSLNKPPKKSKVQYIEPEVAIGLVSGLRNNSSSPSKHCVNRSPMNKPFFSKKAFPSTPPPKQSIKANLSGMSSGCRESLHNFSMPNCTKDDNLQATMAESSRQHYARSSPVKRVTFAKFSKPGVSLDGHAQKFCSKTPIAMQHPFGKLSKDVINSGHTSKLIESSPTVSSDGHAQNVCLETPTAKQLPFNDSSKDVINSGQTSKLIESSPTVSSGADYNTDPRPINIDSNRIELANITMVLDRYLPNHPAVPPMWKGTFEIQNGSSIDCIQAHLPCKAHNNVLTFSKKLPKSLQFEMLPRHSYWMEMFKDDAPCELDIGLYFLPPPGHEQSCSSLVKHLDEHDLLLRSVINEVELFIFSSKHLPEDSREINQKHFLWGLYRSSETTLSIQEELVSEDMDVDMLGGQEVGSVDVVVPKPIAESEADAAPDFTPRKIKEELTDGTEDIILEFEREIQKSFDRFAEMLQKKET